MLLAALLLAAQPIAVECQRWRSGQDLQFCPLERGSHDVLDAADRPQLQQLGRDAIRFSTMPALGGTAAIVEIVDDGGTRLVGRVYALVGHPYLGWDIADDQMFSLSRREYAQLAASVDTAFADYPRLVGEMGEGEMFVCTDGPGFVTERVVRGRVATLAGDCRITEQNEHPNTRIVALFVELVCRHLGHEAASALRPYNVHLRRRCPSRTNNQPAI